MTKLEKEIEKKLTDMVKSHGGLCLKWVCPGWSGVPDRILLLPGGRVIFVETKRPKGGKVSELQKWWSKKLTALGFYAFFVYTYQDIDTLELVIMDTRPQATCGSCAWYGVNDCIDKDPGAADSGAYEE